MHCLCCHRELLPEEEFVCIECLLGFPLVNSEDEQNPLWARLSGQFPFEHATTLAYYQHGDAFTILPRKAKYGGYPHVNDFLARQLLSKLEGSAWPYDIDVIMPVPIHWTKLLQRGYNQAAPIARALSRHWHIPEENSCLKRVKGIRSQTKTVEDMRSEILEGVFALRHPEKLKDKHVLLVDDICTTGSTLCACSKVLQEVPGLRLSVLTLGMTLSV